MRREHRLIRLLISFIGIDYDLLKLSGGDNINRFLFSALLVLLIVAVSFGSVFYGFDLMFHNWNVEVLLSTFFSFTFLNIYLLLLQTFSKEPLPKGYKLSFWTTSNLARFGFVLMIGFLLAQPVRIFFLSDQLDADIDRYKVNLVQSFEAQNAALYKGDLARLDREQMQLSAMNDGPLKSKMESENQSELSLIKNKIYTDNELANTKISASGFFLQRVILAGHYRTSWLICLLVMLIYMLPVILIQTISGNSLYYIHKKTRDHDYILERYADFKQQYSAFFYEKYQLRVDFSEPYKDAPFNWERKPKPECGDAQAFRDDLL